MLIASQAGVKCVAREAEGEERDRAWQAANEQYSGCTDYQSRTRRRIPVLILDEES